MRVNGPSARGLLSVFNRSVRTLRSAAKRFVRNHSKLKTKLVAIIAMGCISHEAFAAATQLEFARQPDGAFSATRFIQQPSVRALNGDGSVDASFTGGITISKQSGSGSLSGTVTVAAVSGTARFTDLKLSGAGHYVLRAASNGLTSARSGMMTVLASASVITSGSIYSPTVWGDSLDATHATNYWIANSHATASFATAATSVNVVVWRTLEAAYDNQAAVAVLVDGAYSSQVLAAWQGRNSDRLFAGWKQNRDVR